jgi:hypothetical protein
MNRPIRKEKLKKLRLKNRAPKATPKTSAIIPPEKKYTYRGDRLTDVKYRGKIAVAVLNLAGKCIRGRNGNMLVSFDGIKVVVMARQLRKVSFNL